MDESRTFWSRTSGATATVSWCDGPPRLVVRGEVDASFADVAAPVLALLSEDGGPVEVDLSGVTCFAAAGLAWLAELEREAPGGARVVAASECVRELAALCGVPLPAPPGGGTARVAHLV